MDWFTKTLVLIHILGAVAGMGPAFMVPVLLAHLRRQPEALPTIVPLLLTAGKFPKYGGMLQLATGLALVGIRGWSLLAATWIWASIVLVLAAATIGATVLEPAGREFGGMLRSGHIDPQAVSRVANRMGRVAAVNTGLLLVILILMVFRP